MDQLKGSPTIPSFLAPLSHQCEKKQSEQDKDLTISMRYHKTQAQK